MESKCFVLIATAGEMKMRILLLSVGAFLVGALVGGSDVAAAGTSGRAKVTQVDSRVSGFHAIYIEGGVPDEGCSRIDRAVLVEGDDGERFSLGVALTALASGRDVILHVDGCVPLDPGSSVTAPRILRISILR